MDESVLVAVEREWLGGKAGGNPMGHKSRGSSLRIFSPAASIATYRVRRIFALKMNP